jgi:hypothetical protein
MPFLWQIHPGSSIVANRVDLRCVSEADHRFSCCDETQQCEIGMPVEVADRYIPEVRRCKER